MIHIILLGISSIFFAYISQYKKYEWGLKVSFILIFLFLALRYDFGRDYMGYYRIFESAKSYSFIQLFDGTLYGEIGWLILCWMFKQFGFYVMVAFLALFSCLLYYRFFINYVPANFYWLAIFLYIFNPGLMLLHTTAMRQSISIALFLLSIEYIVKKDVIRYILIIGFASLFHKSALVLLPVYFLSFIKERLSYKSALLLFTIVILMFLFSDYLKPIVSNLIFSSFENYENYIHLEGSLRSIIGNIYFFLILIIFIYLLPIWEGKAAIINKIFIIYFTIYPLSILIMFILRVGMYFDPIMLSVIPLMTIGLNKKVQSLKIIFILIIIVRTLYAFTSLYKTEGGYEDYGVYQTIFNAI